MGGVEDLGMSDRDIFQIWAKDTPSKNATPLPSSRKEEYAHCI